MGAPEEGGGRVRRCSSVPQGEGLEGAEEGETLVLLRRKTLRALARERNEDS